MATLYQAAQWLKNKVQNGAFVAIEDITIIPSILGHSTPHSRVLQKTHNDFSAQGVTRRLASASPCASTDPMMFLIPKQRGVGWSSFYNFFLEFRHCLLFDCTAVTADINYTIAMSCPCMISYYVNNMYIYMFNTTYAKLHIKLSYFLA